MPNKKQFMTVAQPQHNYEPSCREEIDALLRGNKILVLTDEETLEQTRPYYLSEYCFRKTGKKHEVKYMGALHLDREEWDELKALYTEMTTPQEGGYITFLTQEDEQMEETMEGLLSECVYSIVIVQFNKERSNKFNKQILGLYNNKLGYLVW